MFCHTVLEVVKFQVMVLAFLSFLEGHHALDNIRTWQKNNRAHAEESNQKQIVPLSDSPFLG